VKKWIRWQGVFVFAAVLGILLGFWFLLADLLVERLIERAGTQALGAKVELDGADLSLFPAGLTLQRLQITNPDEPMQNAVEVARISCNLDGLNLLRRKVLIQEMSVEGVRLGTARAYSGAILQARERVSSPVKKEKGEGKCALLELPSFELASVEKILQKEDLKTLKWVESFRKDIAAEGENWQKRLAELPDQKKIEEYRVRVEKLSSSKQRDLGGMVEGLSEVLEVQKEIGKDLERLQKMQKDISNQMTSFQDRLSQLEKAPLEDLQNLKKKYSPSAANLGNWTRLLLECKTQAWVEKSIYWWGKLQPFLERVKPKKGNVETVKPLRGKGVDVRFVERQPLPDFWIRLLQVSFQVEAGELKGRSEDITPDPDILGRPLKFMLTGEKLRFASQVKMEGVLDHVSPERSSDQVKVLLQGSPIKNIILSSREDFPLGLADGIVNLNLQALFQKDTLSADLAAHLQSTHFAIGKKQEGNLLLNAVAAGLSSISQFTIQAKISGPLDHFEIDLFSDLDDQVKRAVQTQVQKYAAEFEKELTSAFLTKVKAPLQDARGNLGGLQSIQKELENRLRQLGGLQTQRVPQKIPGGLKLPF